MEITLNLIWAGVTAAMLCVWLRCGARSGLNRRGQLVAFAVFAMILFPVISVTDDIQAAQNPADVDCCVRRVHEGSSVHAMPSGAAAPPQPVVADVMFGAPIAAIVLVRPAPHVDSPALAVVQNRPPPQV